MDIFSVCLDMDMNFFLSGSFNQLRSGVSGFKDCVWDV